MAAKKLFTQIFIYFSKPLRLLYSLIIYEIVNFSFFTLYSLLLLSFFLYLKSVPIYVIVHAYWNHGYMYIQEMLPKGKDDGWGSHFPQSHIYFITNYQNSRGGVSQGGYPRVPPICRNP